MWCTCATFTISNHYDMKVITHNGDENDCRIKYDCYNDMRPYSFAITTSVNARETVHHINCYEHSQRCASNNPKCMRTPTVLHKVKISLYVVWFSTPPSRNVVSPNRSKQAKARTDLPGRVLNIVKERYVIIMTR